MHRAQHLTTAIALAAARGGANARKGKDHAHLGHTLCCIGYAKPGAL
jgi:hypothetical protein